MNKQLVVAMLLGASLGAGGRSVVEAVGEAAGAGPFVHALDVRRQPQSTSLQVVVYGSKLDVLGKVEKDLGQPKSCKLSGPTEQTLTLALNALSTECVWK